MEKEEWTGEVAVRPLGSESTGHFKAEVPLTRHRERPFGVPAGGVQGTSQRGKGRRTKA